MQIRWIRIGAFGPFVDKKLDLSPGMTVIAGANESGKSTWHAAIYAGICGMRRGAGRRSEDHEFKRRHQPWDGGAWSVEARLVLADGREIEIAQDLEGRVDCRAVDVGIGRRDVSSEIMFEGSPDASRWLGLDRRTFPATAWVRQAQVLEVLTSANALQEHLQRAAATAGADETAARALLFLEEYQREHVGLDRVHSIRPLRRALDGVAVSERALSDARLGHATYLAQLERAEALENEAGDARQRLEILEAATALRQAGALQQNVGRVRELQTELEGEPLDLATLRAAATRVSEAITTWNSAPAPEPLIGPTSAELEREIAASPSVPVGDLAPAATVVAAETQWRSAVRALEAHTASEPPEIAARPTTLSASELRDLARDLSVEVPVVDADAERRHAEFERGLAATPERRVNIPVLIGAAIIAAAGVGVGLMTTPIVVVIGVLAAVGLVAISVRNVIRDPRAAIIADLRRSELLVGSERLAADAVRRTLNAAHARASAAGLPSDPVALAVLAIDVDHRAAAFESRRQWMEASAKHLQALDAAAAVLREALMQRGIGSAEDLDAAVAQYREACGERAEVAGRAARKADLVRQLDTRAQAEAAADIAQKRHADAGRGLILAAHDEGLDAADADGGLVVLRAWQETSNERLAKAEGQARARGEVESLLDGRSLEQLEGEAAEAAKHADALALPLPRDAVATEVNEPDLEARLTVARESAGAARAAVARARGELSQLVSAPAGVSAAEEALAGAREELDRVQRLARTLTATQEFLATAQDRVHRDIAPILERTLCDWLPRITGGRYTEASVDPEVLGVTVKDPTGAFRDADLLSQGTVEQIYLLLRMSLVAHLTAPGENSPLIFDDVTVQTDSARTTAMLDLLHEISVERQVIVFSQEEDVRRWAETSLNPERDSLVSLEAPAPAQ
jgi:DNA repair protein SbcC/Rad50